MEEKKNMRNLTLEELKTHFTIMQSVLSEKTFNEYVARFWANFAKQQ